VLTRLAADAFSSEGRSTKRELQENGTGGRNRKIRKINLERFFSWISGFL